MNPTRGEEKVKREQENINEPIDWQEREAARETHLKTGPDGKKESCETQLFCSIDMWTGLLTELEQWLVRVGVWGLLTNPFSR